MRPDCTCSYNDLGGKDEATNVLAQRPVLGKDPKRGGDLPYPRRLYTGRQIEDIKDGPYKGQKMESLPSGVPWLPYDEVEILLPHLRVIDCTIACAYSFQACTGIQSPSGGGAS